jgi:hypothetical protein
MTDDSYANPFLPTNPVDAPSVAKQPLRGYAKVACIFFIILGALGVLGSLTGAGAFLFKVLASNLDENAAKPFQGSYPGEFAIAAVIAVLSACVSIAMIVAGVFGLQQKRAGARLITNVSIFMILFKIVETAFGAVNFYMGFPAIKEEVLKKIAADPNPPKIDLGPYLDIGFYVAMVFVIAIGLVMLLFYLFTYLHFCKRDVVAQFE